MKIHQAHFRRRLYAAIVNYYLIHDNVRLMIPNREV